MSRSALPILIRGESPEIVFIASIAGMPGMPGLSLYGAIMATLASSARSLAVEWAPRKIRVNALAPGIIPSPLVDEMFRPLTDEQIGAIEKRYPLGFGVPMNVAYATRFLLSPTSKWITGVYYL